MRKFYFILLPALLGLLLCSASFAQSAPQPVTQTWSVNTSSAILPGLGKTIVGIDSGVTFTPSANLDLFERNLLTTDGALKYYAPGFNYRFPAISTKANDKAQNVNFLRVRFGISGSFGVAQVNGTNHYGFTAGIPVDYSLTQSGAWTMGARVEYIHFPGYPVKALIEINTAFHF